MIVYAGIGSRKMTPKDAESIVNKIKPFQDQLRELMFYSGGAPGPDMVFEMLHYPSENKKIFLPWRGFNGSDSQYYNITKEAIALAKKYHPAPSNLSDGALKLMARNCYQVLGEDLQSPIDFIICWCPSETTGGTSQALRIAANYAIPWFNLYHEDAELKLGEFLKGIKK